MQVAATRVGSYQSHDRRVVLPGGDDVTVATQDDAVAREERTEQFFAEILCVTVVGRLHLFSMQAQAGRGAVLENVLLHDLPTSRERAICSRRQPHVHTQIYGESVKGGVRCVEAAIKAGAKMPSGEVEATHGR